MESHEALCATAIRTAFFTATSISAISTSSRTARLASSTHWRAADRECSKSRITSPHRSTPPIVGLRRARSSSTIWTSSARNGVAAPTFDEAMRQYGIFLVYGYFIWMTTEPFMQTEAVNTANAARVSAAMLDHDTVRLVQSIQGL